MLSGLSIRLALRIGRGAAAAAALALPAASALAVWPFGSSAPAEPTHEVKAPYYGDALFYFFQDRYFTSITTLMASQQFERVTHHDDEAEILRGGMLASYGQTKEAGEIFAKLIDRGASPAVRDRAWFYLAKIRYQRGYLPEAEEALNTQIPEFAMETARGRIEEFVQERGHNEVTLDLFQQALAASGRFPS